jgi:hypothetical protein
MRSGGINIYTPAGGGGGSIPRHARTAMIYCDHCGGERLHFRRRWSYATFVAINAFLILATLGLWLVPMIVWLLFTSNERYYCSGCGTAHRRFRVYGFRTSAKVSIFIFLLLVAALIGHCSQQ